jgi:hypothetical protein
MNSYSGLGLNSFLKEFRALKAALTREPFSYLARIVEDDVDTEQLAMDSGGLIVYVGLVFNNFLNVCLFFSFKTQAVVVGN